MRLKTRIGMVLCVAVIAALGASAAFAGEVKGPPYQGDPVSGGIADSSNTTAAVTNGHASVCAFSGLNDYDADLGQTDRQTQTPKDAAPGSAAHGWTISIPGVGDVTISCNKNFTP
jgi:hypothetical protein